MPPRSSSPAPLHPVTRITLGNWITIAMLAFAIIGGWFKFDARLSRAEDANAAITKRIDDLDAYVRRIDQTGTQYSRANIALDAKQVDENTRRIENAEKSLAEVLALTRDMSKDLGFIRGTMQSQPQPTHR